MGWVIRDEHDGGGDNAWKWMRSRSYVQVAGLVIEQARAWCLQTAVTPPPRSCPQNHMLKMSGQKNKLLSPFPESHSSGFSHTLSVSLMHRVIIIVVMSAGVTRHMSR